MSLTTTNGDTHLGGEDFDNRLMKYFLEVLKKKHGKDINKDQKALARLKKAAEIASIDGLVSCHLVFLRNRFFCPGFSFVSSFPSPKRGSFAR